MSDAFAGKEAFAVVVAGGVFIAGVVAAIVILGLAIKFIF